MQSQAPVRRESSMRPCVKPATISVALRCRCPRCGQGRLFDGLLSVRPVCSECGLDLRGHDAGDGPAVLVILVLGFLIVGLALFVDAKFEPPLWLHAVLWLPSTLIGGIALLRPLKAW